MFGTDVVRRAIGGITFFLALLLAPDVRAHGGLSMEEDTCVLRLGPYKMHFVGYQPNSTKAEFCEDIPETGYTIIVLDYIDEPLRDMQAEVRIIKDVGAPETGDLTPITELYMPPAVHPKGTFNFEYNFPRAEKFVGLVTVRNHSQVYTSRFPFSVGTSATGSNLLHYSLIALALVAALVVFWFTRRRPTMEPASASPQGSRAD